MKIRKWFLFGFAILALTFGVFGFTSVSSVKTAKAETYRTFEILDKRNNFGRRRNAYERLSRQFQSVYVRSLYGR